MNTQAETIQMFPLIEYSVCYHNNPFRKKRISAVNVTPLPNSGTASFQGPSSKLQKEGKICMSGF